VQRKEPGFGTAYETQRSGEWEYMTFRPDRSYALPQGAPAGSIPNTNACAACHQDAGATRDWLFRMDLFYYGRSGAVPQAPPGLESLGRVVMQDYLFLAPTISVKPGETVTWINEDDAVHTVTAGDASFNSGRMGLGALFSQRFDQPGTYDYLCAVHPTMKGTVVVE
jgi:plastocyanin